MGYRVVCVSSQDGAGADDAAQLVAKDLGFRLIDEEIVTQAAVSADLEPSTIADVERRKSMLSRLLEGLAPAAAVAPMAPMPAVVAFGQPASDELRGLIRSAIEETAAGGEVVLVAHAASHALSGRDDVLRVLITASDETRRRRMAEEFQVDEKEAGRRMSRSDAGRADYLKRFYGVGAERPTHYDLVINTDKVSPDTAARLIVGTVREPA
jgi:cytidylate kinase